MNHMIELQYIIGTSMALTNVVKKRIPKAAVPIVAVGFSVALNMLNAYIFGGDMHEAASLAFVSGGITAGLFVAGDAARKMLTEGE